MAMPSPVPPDGVRVGRHTLVVPFCETPEFQVGDLGVYRVKRFLQSKGAFVFSTCDLSGKFSDKAPAIEGATRRVILPDLDVSWAGRHRFWAEVKTKGAATWTRRTQRLEHGIAQRHWFAYQNIQKITRCDVWLFIYQRDESIVLGSRIDDFKTDDRFRPSNMRDRLTGRLTPHVFFPYDAFRLRADLPVDINEPAIFSVQLKLRFCEMSGTSAATVLSQQVPQ